MTDDHDEREDVGSEGTTELVRQDTGAKIIRTAESEIVERLEDSVVAHFTAAISVHSHRIDEQRTTLNMTKQHATAIIEAKRMEFAVPEEQRTLRSKQQTLRLLIVALIGIGCVGFMVYEPAVAKEILALLVAVSGGVAWTEYINREKSKKKQLPEETGT